MSPETALVISPHFDDAVMSCGSWIKRHPGTVVATVCSGMPGSGVGPIPWDARSGFVSGDDAATGRRGEDASALAFLDAQQVALGFLDGEYRTKVDRCHEDLAITEAFQTALEASLVRLVDDLHPTICVAPLGLEHGDHIVTAAAARNVLPGRFGCRFVAYRDLPYAITRPGLVTAALDLTTRSGYRVDYYPTHDAGSAELSAKEQAVACYASQAEQLSEAHPRWLECLRPAAEFFYRLKPTLAAE